MTYNELQGCKKDIVRIPLNGFDEVFAVDGGSTDGTIEYLQSHGIKVYLQPKKGLNAAYVHANNIATGDAVVVFPAKGALPPEDLLKFKVLFEKGNELVIASRQLPGSINEEDVFFWRPRKWAVFGLAVMAGLIWRREGVWVRDVLSGFKGWKRSAFSRMKVLDVGLSIDIEMVVRAYKLKIQRIEFPTKETTRHYSQTHFKFWPTGKLLFKYLCFELFRRD